MAQPNHKYCKNVPNIRQSIC